MTIQERVCKAAKTLLEKQGHDIITEIDDEQLIISFDNDEETLVITKYQWGEGIMPDPDWTRAEFEKQSIAFVLGDLGSEWADYPMRADAMGMAITDDRAFVRQIKHYDFSYAKEE